MHMYINFLVCGGQMSALDVSQRLSTLYFVTDSLTGPRHSLIQLDHLAKEMHLSSVGITHKRHHTWLFIERQESHFPWLHSKFLTIKAISPNPRI